MKNCTLGLGFALAIATVAWPASAKSEGQGTASTAYDAKLAAELGADEYGMRSYVVVLLKTGPAEITDPDRLDELFAGHLANIARLAQAGELVLAGPLDGVGGKRGLLILNAPDIDAAREMLEMDPSVAAGIFDPEFSQFYASAGLMRMNDLNKALQPPKSGD